MILYIGTQTQGSSEGIYQSQFDEKSGLFTSPVNTIVTNNPTWLTLNAENNTLFSICEQEDSAIVESYQLDNSTSRLINRVNVAAQNPCHATYANNTLVVSCYVSGSLASLAVDKQGQLQQPASLFQQPTSAIKAGQDINRQESAHIHSAQFSPCTNKVWCLDLGKDQILQFDFCKNSSQLQLDKIYPVKAGSGPRHMAIHPNGKWVYVAMELSLEVSFFTWQQQQLTEQQRISCFSEKPKQHSLLSEIVIHDNGLFCYLAIRGTNQIACFNIDQQTGELSLMTLTDCAGDWPRHICISPNGQWLLVANQLSSNISLFAINEKTGKLTASAQQLLIDTPMCLRFRDSSV